MGKRILNKTNCVFFCPSSPLVKFTIQQMDNHVNDGTGIALTTKAQLSGVGNCVIQTAAAGGAPVPCSFQAASTWISGIELLKTINGANLLNEDAKQICPICPASPVQIQLMIPPVLPTVPVIPSVASLSINASLSENNNAEISEVSQKNNGETQFSQEESTINEESIPPSESSNNEASPQLKECLCAYTTCENSSSCPYANSSELLPASSQKPSQLLRNNSKEKYSMYYEMASEKMNRYQISWAEQAHHMISVKDGYAEFPILVKLGNYFCYDINCQENCCFLPAFEREEGFGKYTEHFKKARAYDVMKASGMQWHVSHHDRLVQVPEPILIKYPELQNAAQDGGLKTYKDLIVEKLRRFMQECQQRFETICICENYEEHQAWFLRKMHGLSREIEERLDAFKQRGRNSFPYFVSPEAFRFAYEIPRSGKVILIYKTQTQWVLQRYQFKNTVKDPDIQLDLTENERFSIAERHRPETVRSIILNCENVSCFLVRDDTHTFKLPFSFHVHMQYISQSDCSEFSIKNHFAAMLAEMSESGEDEYISPQLMKKERLKECDLL
jgi:hypothetical protein